MVKIRHKVNALHVNWLQQKVKQMQTNNSFEKIYKSSIIRKQQGEQTNKPKAKANKTKRIINKRDW